jgi:hypothetical protein
MVDRDIFALAALMIMRFGPNARMAAALRADTFAAKGDYVGAAIWDRIMRIIESSNNLSELETLH